MRRSRALLSIVALFALACSGKQDAPREDATPKQEQKQEQKQEATAAHRDPEPAPRGKPEFVAGALPVAPFVAEQLIAAEQRTVVYVGASWCEPCQRFHRAVEAGELDQALSGVRFLEYDYDQHKDALAAAGYSSRLIPLFVMPEPDGRGGSRAIQGSIKGDGAVGNILPRLQALLAGN